MLATRDILEVKKISITDDYIEKLAEKYIQLRSQIIVDDTHPIFKATGFSTDKLKQIVKDNAKPLRVEKDKLKAVNDIYRSDIGELLLTVYFEEEQSNNFILPLKNIWDREHSDLPGRGFDGIGYRITNSNRVQLLLGEAKVTVEKSIPKVVDSKYDSLYKTHLKHRNDRTYLIRKITSYAKKLLGNSAAIMQYILFCLSENNDDEFDIVYGCCMVRDYRQMKDPDDFGKFNSDSDVFKPGSVQFIIYSFDKDIEDVVDLFHQKVEEL